MGGCGLTLLLYFIIQSFFLLSDPIQSTLVPSNHFNCLQSPSVKFPYIMARSSYTPPYHLLRTGYLLHCHLKPAFSRLILMFYDGRGQSMISTSVLVTLSPFLVFQELINCCSYCSGYLQQ